jgi:hypothetical protein
MTTTGAATPSQKHLFLEGGIYRFRRLRVKHLRGQIPGGFWKGLKGSTGRSDANTQLFGDDPPRGTCGSKRGDLCSIHRGTRTPNRFPFDWASRSAASPALPRRPEPNPASGRNTHRWDDVPNSGRRVR